MESLTCPETGHSTEFQEEAEEKIVESVAKNDLAPKKEESDALGVIAGLRSIRGMFGKKPELANAISKQFDFLGQTGLDPPSTEPLSTSSQEHRQECVDGGRILPEEEARENDTKAEEPTENRLTSVQEVIVEEDETENDESDEDSDESDSDTVQSDAKSVTQTLTDIRQMVKKMPEFTKRQPKQQLGFSGDTSQDPVAEKPSSLEYKEQQHENEGLTDPLAFSFSLQTIQSMVDEIPKLAESVSKQFVDEIPKLAESVSKQFVDEIPKLAESVSKQFVDEIPKLAESVSKQFVDEIPKLTESFSKQFGISDVFDFPAEKALTQDQVEEIGQGGGDGPKDAFSVLTTLRGLRKMLAEKPEIMQTTISKQSSSSFDDTSSKDESSSQDGSMDKSMSDVSTIGDEIKFSKVENASVVSHRRLKKGVSWYEEPPEELRRDSSEDKSGSESPSGDEREPCEVNEREPCEVTEVIEATDTGNVMSILRGLRKRVSEMPEIVQDHSKQTPELVQDNSEVSEEGVEHGYQFEIGCKTI
jgi:hypothetical protein